MPPSAGSRSEHSHHSGYDDDETLMLEQAMDKADRASNRLEVRHRIPPRMYERVHKNASASRQTRPPPSTAPAPDLPRTRGPDASGPSHRRRRFRSKNALPLTRSRLSRASLHASAGYPRAGAPRRPRRRARRFPRRARFGERQGGRARDGQPGGPARALRGGEDRTRADDGLTAVRRRRRRVQRVGRIELGEPRIELGALGSRDAKRGAEQSRAVKSDGHEQMGRSAKRERQKLVDAKERIKRVVWDGSRERRRRGTRRRIAFPR